MTRITSLLLIAAMWAGSAAAQTTYPNRVVTLVVPTSSGSGADSIGRILGPRLHERWRQAVVVDNKPGASGNIGATAVAKAKPDGLTLLISTNALTMAPYLYKERPFDPIADLAPVIKFGVAGFCLVANPAFPANDVAGAIALAKSKPGQVNYATPGNGTPHHLGMELLKLRTGADFTHIPYKGISGAISDVLGGQVPMMFATLHSVLPLVTAGKLKLLAVTGARSPLAPKTPTFREQGLGYMDEAIDGWYGLFAPAGTPPEIIAKLHADMSAVLAVPEVREKLGHQGVEVQASSPAELAALVRSDVARWRKVVADAKITAD